MKSLFLGWLAAGLLVALTLPPFQAPDENAHWKTALARVSFYKTHPRCSVGMGLADQFRDRDPHFRALESREACVDADVYYGTWLSYPGVLASRWFAPFLAQEKDSPRRWLSSFYFARWIQGLVVGFFLWRLLTLLPPPLAFPLLAFAYSPLFLQQSFSVSADGVVLAFTFLLAEVLFRREPFSRWDELIFFVLAFVATATKVPILFPGVLVFLHAQFLREKPLFPSLAPERTHSPPPSQLIRTLSFAGAWILWTLFYAKGSTQHALAFNQFTPGFHEAVAEFGPADPTAQVQHLLAHPFNSLKLVFQPLAGFLNLEAYVGVLGWWSVWPDRVTVRMWQGLNWAAWLMLVTSLFRSGQIRSWITSLRHHARILFGMGLACLASWSVQVLGIYIGGNPVARPYVGGLQPRYFLPLVILGMTSLLLTLPGARATSPRNIRLFWVELLALLYLPLLMIQLFLDFQFRFY